MADAKAKQSKDANDAGNTVDGFKAGDFITKRELQEWLGLKDSQRRGFHDKGLPFIRVGLVVLYHVPEVCKWLKAQETTKSEGDE